MNKPNQQMFWVMVALYVKSNSSIIHSEVGKTHNNSVKTNQALFKTNWNNAEQENTLTK